MVRRFLPLSLVLLSGCAFSPPLFAPATPIEVQVPVYQPVYCTPPTLANPKLPVAALTAASPPADTIRAYAASVVLLKGAVRELNSIIQGCEEPAAASAAGGIANGAAAPSGATSSSGMSPSIGVTPGMPPSIGVTPTAAATPPSGLAPPTSAPPLDASPADGPIADSIRVIVSKFRALE
jgi:hypothetical protein